MDQKRLAELLKKKGITPTRGQMEIDLNKDFPQDCAYVDLLVRGALKMGHCAKMLRNLMVAYSVGIYQRADGKDYLFEPEAICHAIKLLEGIEDTDFTKGPFTYEKGPLAGLHKKHFFQASFLPENILKEIEREGVGIIFRKLSEYYGRGNYIGKPLERLDLQLMAEALTKDVIERRAARRAKSRDGGLTGEHLIYAALPSGNIYLYVSYHGEDPEQIARYVRVSRQDFPELVGTAPVFNSSDEI
jgi:hypothetical protein